MAKIPGQDNGDPDQKTRLVRNAKVEPHPPPETVMLEGNGPGQSSDDKHGRTVLLHRGSADRSAENRRTECDDPVVGWVVVIEGPGKGISLPLGYGMNEVSRSPRARVPLDFGDLEISREKHAVISFDPRGLKFYIQQGSGKNLTYVDDAPVLAPQELHTGQQITLGETRLRFIALCGPDFDWQRSGSGEGGAS